jgi:hypothetical protein
MIRRGCGPRSGREDRLLESYRIGAYANYVCCKMALKLRTDVPLHVYLSQCVCPAYPALAPVPVWMFALHASCVVDSWHNRVAFTFVNALLTHVAWRGVYSCCVHFCRQASAFRGASMDTGGLRAVGT